MCIRGEESGEGTGFSSEIETSYFRHVRLLTLIVARELASHLRLKLPCRLFVSCHPCRGEGTGFSSEIETAAKSAAGTLADRVARELASHLRLKHYVWQALGYRA